MKLKEKQQEVNEYYANTGHIHTGSRDWMFCHTCNPLLPKPKPIGYIYNCNKCGEQFMVKKFKKKKKRLCKNCK